MNTTKYKVPCMLVSTLLLAISCHSIASSNCDDPLVPSVVIDAAEQMVSEPVTSADVLTVEAPVVEPEPSPVEAPVYQVLSDKIHQLESTLESMTAVHHYSFTSVRGQDVVLGTPERATFNTLWKVEYQVDGGKWELKKFAGPEAFKGLNPGSVVKVRVSGLSGDAAADLHYKVVLGSYPHMSYDLHDEEGLLKIPHGFADPAFLATQAIQKALLEVKFWDSKGEPLEGAVFSFDLRRPGEPPLATAELTSEGDGKGLELLEFRKCEGGKPAEYFKHKQEYGVNTWGTNYQVAQYRGKNVLLEDLADKAHQYNFGHVCKRYLVNWSRY
jgi:hypothetical protein